MNISPTSLMLLVSGFATGRILLDKFLAPFLHPVGGVLTIQLVGLAVFVGSFWLDQQLDANRERRRFWLVVAGAIFILGTVTVREIGYRAQLPIVSDWSKNAWNDGALQSTVAAQLLINGHNPYRADFNTTIFGQLFEQPPGLGESQVLQHYAYPPGMILINVPAVWMNQVFNVALDTQVIYLVILVLLVALLALNTGDWSQRTLIVVLLLYNPFIWMYWAAGFNDIVVITAIVGSALTIGRKHWLVGGLAFGLALTLKQTAWLIAPLWLYWLWRQRNDHRVDMAAIKKTIGAAAIAALVVYLPFLVWDAPALFEDVARYIFGGLPMTYPLSGISLQALLSLWHLVPSVWAPTPTWLLVLLLVLPTMVLLAHWLRRRPTVSRWLLVAALSFMAMALVNRFGAQNYYAAVVTLVTISYLLQNNEPVQPARS